MTTILLSRYKAVYDVMLYMWWGYEHKITLFQRPKYKTTEDNNNIY